MEDREPASPKATLTHPLHGRHVSFGSYLQRDYPFMGSSPSIIAPTAKRHTFTTQPLSLICNSTDHSDANYNPSLHSKSVVPNLNPGVVSNPGSASPMYFGATEATAAPSPPFPQALMVSLERALSDPMKKKRGRPRKYANGVLDGSPLPAASGPVKKKGPGSAKKVQLAALGVGGQNFTPHVLLVNAGEDVSTRIITFTSQGPWAVCILSANGTISNATLSHAGVSGGAITYEGLFEILSLAGSFLLTEDSGTRSRTGGLSVSLSGPDGRVIGGGVAGLLMAASPVQVVLGTFATENPKGKAAIDERIPTSVPITGMKGVDSVQEHVLAACGDGDEPRVYCPLPLQSMDYFGVSQLEGDARGESDPESASTGGP